MKFLLGALVGAFCGGFLYEQGINISDQLAQTINGPEIVRLTSNVAKIVVGFGQKNISP